MKSHAKTVDEYLISVDIKWKASIIKLRDIINANIPQGFQEVMNYGMIGYVVPHSIYPKGYHANPKEPLPFVNLAAQKNHVAIYHMGLYGDKNLKAWFETEYGMLFGKKPNVGGACIRFKKDEDIPYSLIQELIKKIDIHEYIAHYEAARVKST
jgi:hypothetical protein